MGGHKPWGGIKGPHRGSLGECQESGTRALRPPPRPLEADREAREARGQRQLPGVSLGLPLPLPPAHPRILHEGAHQALPGQQRHGRLLRHMEFGHDHSEWHHPAPMLCALSPPCSRLCRASVSGRAGPGEPSTGLRAASPRLSQHSLPVEHSAYSGWNLFAISDLNPQAIVIVVDDSNPSKSFSRAKCL